MKIKALHYVFGPCLKGYDIYERKVTVQMGQKTIGLSEELLSHAEILQKLEELAFGDALEPNSPFEKIYFSTLPDNHFVIGRGIRGMDSAGRGAYFFHHLVIEESAFLKIKGNPLTIFKKFHFFEKEADFPSERLIPAAEIQISEEDYRFPLVISSKKAHMENLLSDIFSENSGQPVWVVLERGEERSFLEQLLGIIPYNERKQMSFSTDFYNSYNIQHYFRLVTVNTEDEIPYKNCIIYNFKDKVFPDRPVKKYTYLETISKLSPEEVLTFTADLSHLQLNYTNSDELASCRNIFRSYIEKGAHYPAVFHELVPLETGTVLLGSRQPEEKLDYPAFCDFYSQLMDQIKPEWFLRFYPSLPVPLDLLIALFKLVESHYASAFRKQVFDLVYSQLESAGKAEILNQLNQQFPQLIQDMLEYFRKEIRRLFKLVLVLDLENLIRSKITGLIYREMLDQSREEYIHQLPSVIKSLDDFGMNTAPLKILVEMKIIKETEKFPDKGLEKYTMIDKDQYREFMRIGMNMVNRTGISLTKMCDYLYTARFSRVFVKTWLDFIRENEISINPMELIIYMEKQNWLHLDTRKEIFDFLEKGSIGFFRIRKYRNVLKKAGKDIFQYQSLWESIKKKVLRR